MNTYAVELAEKLTAKFSTPESIKAHSRHSHQITVDPGGRKFTRLVTHSVMHLNSGTTPTQGGSVHCFVDAEGNVYKAAGWKAPAQHVRANVSTDEGMAAAVAKADPYGGWLYL